MGLHVQTWMSDYMVFLCDMITYPCAKLNAALTNLL